MVAKTAGRKGYRWRLARAIVLANSDTCWICGHQGARTADHVVSRKECIATGRLDLLDNPENLRPAHGARNRCPACGRCCNQERGSGERTRVTARRSRTW